MRHCALLAGFASALFLFSGPIAAETIRGKVVDQAGKPIEGVMVSAIDDEHRKWTSVFTQKDGSFSIDGLRDVPHNIRTRLMGLADDWSSRGVAPTLDPEDVFNDSEIDAVLICSPTPTHAGSRSHATAGAPEHCHPLRQRR